AKSPKTRLPGVFIQKEIVPLLELRAGIAGTVMRFRMGALKSITPLRPFSLAVQIAPMFVPGWVPEGLLSTMTLLAGAESKLKRRRSEASITSAARTGLELETINTNEPRTRASLFIRRF